MRSFGPGKIGPLLPPRLVKAEASNLKVCQHKIPKKERIRFSIGHLDGAIATTRRVGKFAEMDLALNARSTTVFGGPDLSSSDTTPDKMAAVIRARIAWMLFVGCFDMILDRSPHNDLKLCTFHVSTQLLNNRDGFHG